MADPAKTPQETDDFQPVDMSTIAKSSTATAPSNAPLPGETDDFQPVTKDMLAPREHKFLERDQNESTLAGVGKNAATGVVKGASWIAGMPGDVQSLIKKGVAGLRHTFNNEDYDKALADIDQRTQGTNLPTSEEVEKYLTDKTGAYNPETFWGRVGQQAVAGATSALVPGGLAKAGTRAALGAVSGAAADIAGEAAGPEAGFIAGVGAPFLAHNALRYGAEQLGRTSAQRAARSTRAGVAPAPGDPTSIGQGLTDHADQIMQQHEAQLQALQQGAESAAAKAPQGGNLDQLHERVQDLAYQSGKDTRVKLDALAKTIDPEGKLNVLTTQVRDHAQQLLPEVEGRVKANAAAPYVKAASEFGDVVPFHKLWDFDRELSGAISQAATSGDQNGLRELRDLKAKVKETISKAADNQHAWEQAAVARGDLTQEETLAARQQRQSAAAQTGTGSYVGLVRPNRTGRPGQQRPSAAVPPGGGAPTAGETPLAPNVQPDTADKLTDFNKQYGDYAGTYRSGVVGQGLKRDAYGNFANPQAGKTIFAPGDAGAQNVQAWLQANNSPEAIENLRSIASQRLRESLDADGLINQQKLDAWKRKYGKALGAIDQVSPGFSQSFDSAAQATEALAQASSAAAAQRKALTQGAAGRLMGMDNADDVTGAIGQLINARDSGKQIQALKAKIGSNPDAWQGVQQAAADHVTNEILPKGQLDNFIKNSPTAINEIFGKDADKVLAQLSENQKRMYQLGHAQSPTHGLGIFALWEALSHDPIHGIGIFAANAVANKALRSFNKWRVEGLNNTQEIYQRALTDPAFRQDLLAKAFKLKSGETISKLELLQRAGIAAHASQDATRTGFARGGSVGAEDLGMRMVREVARIRKDHAAHTEPLLDKHDNQIATALAVARQAAGA